MCIHVFTCTETAVCVPVPPTVPLQPSITHPWWSTGTRRSWSVSPAAVSWAWGGWWRGTCPPHSILVPSTWRPQMWGIRWYCGYAWRWWATSLNVPLRCRRFRGTVSAPSGTWCWRCSSRQLGNRAHCLWSPLATVTTTMSVSALSSLHRLV